MGKAAKVAKGAKAVKKTAPKAKAAEKAENTLAETFAHYRELETKQGAFAWAVEPYAGPVQADADQVVRAVEALQQFSAKQSANQKMLFDDNAQTVTLVFGLSGIPTHFESRPYFIKLPNPLYNDETEAILLTRDPQRKFKDLLDKHPVPCVKKVLGLGKLRKRYQTNEQKTELANAYELFLCDAQIYHGIHGHTGKQICKKKWPIPVTISGQYTKEKFQKVLECTFFRTPTGPSIGVKVGRCNFDPEALAANIAAVIPRVAQVVEDKHKLFVNGISLTATDCPSLQVYARTDVAALVERDMAKEKAAGEKKRAKVAERRKKFIEKKILERGGRLRRHEEVDEDDNDEEVGQVAPATDSEDELVPTKAAEPVKVTVKDHKKTKKVTKKNGKKKAAKA